ncbi:MAG: sigma-54 dependent transcriptional regulator [Pseudomonadota bacterium]
MTATGNILIIDDDPDVLTAAQLLLKRHYGQVTTVDDPTLIPAQLQQQQWDVVLLDMNFSIGANSGAEGLHWLGQILQQQPQAQVVLMTAYGSVDTAVRAFKQGAADFVLKPWENDRLLTTVGAAYRLRQSRAEVQHLKSRERELQPVASAASSLIGESQTMRDIHTAISRVAPTTANVLILGENGTGKEVVAREIHRLSKRADEVFISVDLGSVAESLFESELFGHKKGAFTGAATDRIGRLQAASGGTLFLDEIGNLPLHLQGKLLSVLEQRQVLPVGSNVPVNIDVRLLCATNMPLRKMIRDGSFREDLLYRINTVEVTLPPLRERNGDLALLLDHFIDHYARRHNLPKRKVNSRLLEQLGNYRWPGNVRELRHAIERAMIMGQDEYLQASEILLAATAMTDPADNAVASGHAELNLDKLEQGAIENALRKHAGNISHAARELGLTRTSLYRRMEKYGL